MSRQWGHGHEAGRRAGIEFAYEDVGDLLGALVNAERAVETIVALLQSGKNSEALAISRILFQYICWKTGRTRTVS